MISFILASLLFLTSSSVFNQVVFLDQALWPGENISNLKLPYSLGPKLTAKSALVVDIDTGEILFEKNKTAVLPIASITKLMTALVFLENKTKQWDELVMVEPEDLIIRLESPFTSLTEEKIESILTPAGLNIGAGEKLSVQDIFYGGLIKSANNAMRILARLTKLNGEKTFVDLMNEKAKTLDMTNTYFIEPTGLSPKNYSTAQDLVKLLKEAMQKDEIRQAMGKRIYDINIIGINGQKRYQRIYSTNKLLNSFVSLVGAKTGYLDESGYCLVGLSNYQNRQLAVVILGAATDQDRFQEVKSLIWWTILP